MATPSVLDDRPKVWAEFVILAGDHDNPRIHARFSSEEGLEMVAGLISEAGSVEAAKESFRRAMERMVRRA